MEGLRRRGVDVVSAADVGLRIAPDDAILAFANSSGRVVVTRDHDFRRLHDAGAEHAGIVFLARSTEIGGIIDAVLLVFGASSAAEMRGHIEFL